MHSNISSLCLATTQAPPFWHGLEEQGNFKGKRKKKHHLQQLFLSRLMLKCCLMIAKDPYLKRRIVMSTLAFFEFFGVVKLVGGQ